LSAELDQVNGESLVLAFRSASISFWRSANVPLLTGLKQMAAPPVGLRENSVSNVISAVDIPNR
jgi:hypothetical protein